jgi:cytochrome c-type biogenesis protein CcmH
MIYLYMLGLALLLMLPMVFAFRGRRGLRDRREAALALHRAQLAELARDLSDGRIAATEYAGAKLEVERRLLNADGFSESTPDGNAALLLVAAMIVIPIMAFALYLPGSTPTVPSEPHTQWVVQQQAQQQRLTGLIVALRMHLAGLDPNSVQASQGEAYLAEALAEQASAITPESLSLFQESLAHAPADASWRALDEQRLAQAQQSAQ